MLGYVRRSEPIGTDPSRDGAVPRILVTNDDGIDSVGLHVLARAMVPHGDVVVVAPDSEYSGAGAALGALHLIQPGGASGPPSTASPRRGRSTGRPGCA